MSNKSPFYQQYTMLRPERINSAYKILESPLDGQPEFIHFYSINGEKIAFLGNAPLAEADLYNKFIRTNKMVLPEGARMVNPRALRTLIDAAHKELPYNMDQDYLFWGEPLRDTILLNVCGEVKVSDFKALHFHNCKNRKYSYSHTHLPPQFGGTCDQGIFTTFLGNDDTETLKHDLVIFYVSIEKIRAIDKRIIAEYNSDHKPKASDKIRPIEDILRHYFDTPYFVEREYDYTPQYDWNNLKGIFLIPTLLSDQRTLYHCLPNATLISKEGKNYHQNSLSYWLEMVKEPIPSGQELVISGNDENFIYIEEWSTFFRKNATMEVVQKEDLYLDSILAAEIS